MYEVARAYRDGSGVECNEGKAAHWMRQAADGRFRPAMRTFSEMARRGLGTPLDPMLAARYESMCDPDDYDDYEEDYYDPRPWNGGFVGRSMRTDQDILDGPRLP
jgi:TPR repeat protein